MMVTTRTRTWTAWCSAMLGLCALTSMGLGTAWAGDARVADGATSRHVIVDANDAGLDEVLAALSERFGFAVDHVTSPNERVRFSGRLEGSLEGVLGRILRNEGHIIVRAEKSQAGISSIIVMGPKVGAPAITAQVAPGGQSDKALPAKEAEKLSPSTTPSQHSSAAPPGGANVPGSPGSVSAATASDATLRQLDELGRQAMKMAELQRNAQTEDRTPRTHTSDSAGMDSDLQSLTKQATANMQALVASLRAVCLGASCPAR